MEITNIKITPQWSKSKSEIWDEMFAGLEDVKAIPMVRRRSLWQYAAAAVIAFFVSGSLFAFLYTTTETVGRGAHLLVELPDGSSVDMNAETELSYKPYWWYMSRDVELTGEAFFDVKRGSRFAVNSGGNQVNVLGTSFNIFARADKYVVTCITGQVEVCADSDTAMLQPSMQASLYGDRLSVERDASATQTIDWVDFKFSFIGVPLSEVVAEVERQYDIEITTSSKLNYLYTGNFSRKNSPQEVLEIIGRPFEITFNIE